MKVFGLNDILCMLIIWRHDDMLLRRNFVDVARECVVFMHYYHNISSTRGVVLFASSSACLLRCMYG